MKRAAWSLLVAALGLAAFACWGMFTQSGARQFDEMAGMIPVFAGLVAGVFLLGAAGLGLAARFRS